jgi:hypothetical protein
MLGQGIQRLVPGSKRSANPIRCTSDAGPLYGDDLGSCHAPEELGQSSGNQGCAFMVTPYGIIWQAWAAIPLSVKYARVWPLSNERALLMPIATIVRPPH